MGKILDRRKAEADAQARQIARDVQKGRALLQDANRLLKQARTPKAKYQAEAKKIEALSILHLAKGKKLSLAYYRKTGKHKSFPLKDGTRLAIVKLGGRI